MAVFVEIGYYLLDPWADSIGIRGNLGHIAIFFDQLNQFELAFKFISDAL
ncbi:MAG: hypothetical protein ACD_39C01077G0001 [uncultured bacterium]|nr:MAG: hypothetical protein ACD_39C01077G0001 [uncultured bacterium]